MFSDITLKRIAHLYIIIWIIIILILITGFCMFHYFIAGESHVPFIISKLVVISSANTANINLSEGEYTAEVLQNNDIYLSISKNPKYKKEDSIKTVIIRNFKSADNVSNLEIYRPANTSQLYTYNDNYLADAITYNGGQYTDIRDDRLQIANQGGTINFSIIQNHLGNISYLENEDINIDGTLLSTLNKSIEELQIEVSFDLEITLVSGKVFYTNINLVLPSGDILTNGISSVEYDKLDELIYKRK